MFLRTCCAVAMKTVLPLVLSQITSFCINPAPSTPANVRQYGNHVCSKHDPLSHFEGLKMRLYLSQEFSRQYHYGCYLFFYCDAKFKEHHLNIPKDVLYPVFYHFSCKPHDVINPNLHNTKTSISLKRKMIFQKQKRHSSVF